MCFMLFGEPEGTGSDGGMAWAAEEWGAVSQGRWTWRAAHWWSAIGARRGEVHVWGGANGQADGAG
jgi:hypothetical protein